MPDTGKLEFLRIPSCSHDVRVETGVREGDEISVFYDPMIAKVIVHGHDRLEALRKLDKALQEFHVVGVRTNIPLLRRILNEEHFSKGSVDTGYIKQHQEILFAKLKPDDGVIGLAAVLRFLSSSMQS
jgi:3-methylcrotonyl-CoA carboxylase alpha subunit